MKRFNETYRQRKFITRNQWADTYKATHADTEEDVILKVLVNQNNDEKYINNLLEEVEKIKKIRNNNLIHVNNMFQYSAFEKTYPYIEGESFKGISLTEKIASTKFNNDEAIKIAIELASGIREFHKVNILFNNLNLDNIYINKKNIVKIDILPYLENKKFPVISDENSDEDTTENIKEEIFTPEKDIYDLGVVLYSLLSGNSIFEVNKISQYICDKNLLCIIEKATDDKLESRYHTINRFIADLKSYLSCGELSNDDTEEDKVVKSKRKKGKFGKTLGICITFAIVVGGSVYGYDYLQKNSNIKNNKTEVLNEKTNEEKNKESKKESNDNKEVKEDKVDENKATTSNNINSNESTGNNSSNNSSNNTVSKPNVDTNQPNNNQNSGSTNTTPDGGNNDKVEETPEVTPTPNPTPTPEPTPTPNPTPDNSGESVTPEVPQS